MKRKDIPAQRSIHVVDVKPELLKKYTLNTKKNTFTMKFIV